MSYARELRLKRLATACADAGIYIASSSVTMTFKGGLALSCDYCAHDLVDGDAFRLLSTSPLVAVHDECFQLEHVGEYSRALEAAKQ